MNEAIAFHGEVKRFERLVVVLDGYDPANADKPRVRVLTQAEIEAAKHGEACTCEQHGLRPGLTRKELGHLGAGCCDSSINPGKGWVCPTLDRLRRKWDAS